MIDITKIIEVFSGYKPWLLLALAVFVWIAPLHFAVKFVDGDTNLLKSLAYSILSAFLSLFSVLLFSLAKIGEYGLILGFILIVWLYSRKFKVGLIRAILILVLQSVFGIIVSFIINYFDIISVKEALKNIGVKS